MKISPARAYLIQKIRALEHKLRNKNNNLKRLSKIREDMND